MANETLDKTFGAYHLADHPELYESARNNTFKFILNADLDSLIPAGLDADLATENDYLNNSQERLACSVITTSIPQFKLGTISIKRGNSQVKFAGTPEWSSGTLKLNDFVGARTKDIIMAWQARAYNILNDTVALASNYKYDCTLIEYNPDMTKVIREWTLKGCWISSVDESEFDTQNHEERTFTATLEYDRGIPKSYNPNAN